MAEEPKKSEKGGLSPKVIRPVWQTVLIFIVLWFGLYFGLAAMFPGVRLDHALVPRLLFIAVTGLLAGRIAWIFR